LSKISVRSASYIDRDLISALLASAQLRHIHLDWVPALDLIDDQLFYLALQNDLPLGCLAAPPDPMPIAWVRVFAAVQDAHSDTLWDMLWSDLHQKAQSMGMRMIYSLALHSWFEPLLERAGFEAVNEVIFYEWSGSGGVLERDRRLSIRRMRQTDLVGVEQIDHDSFAPAWQNSIRTLSTASKLSTNATVCEVEGELVGYQISTASALGAHLARLAVKRDYQRQGIGRALVVDLIRHVTRRGFDRVTVNTQADNLSSQKLYRSLGFEPTDQRYPMYAFSVAPAK
jgi:ribosomal protein S18 acetylase RimI-like enzyme